MNRAERRREAREAHVAAKGLGNHYRPPKEREVPPKVPGEHRWVAMAAWFLSDEAVRTAHDPAALNLLDQENMFSLSMLCWDCEQPLGVIAHGSRCTAKGDDR